MSLFLTTPGTPAPLGVSWSEDGINFAIFSRDASAVTLCITNDKGLYQEFSMIKTDAIWHLKIDPLNGDFQYFYRVAGQNGIQNQFYEALNLLDPYAKNVFSTHVWGKNTSYRPMGSVSEPTVFDWENVKSPQRKANELIIYEMHVRGFTKDSSSQCRYPGTYLGLIEKIPHLLDLGVNAVELLPVHEFNECEYEQLHPFTQDVLYNYWGYSTVNFFAPMQRYATRSDHNAAIAEFKTMVRELHRNGIEVILDVVYNHTAEGNEEGPIISWKGIDNSVYYLLHSKGQYKNYSGCGNTFNCNNEVGKKLILDSLRYWVSEMHVDGFRFDLASILTRSETGEPLEKPPLIEAITKDPILSKVKLIAEPWDAGGLYQVGGLFVQHPRWSEWNARYRDSVRKFIRGGGHPGAFVTNLCGSQDLYWSKDPASSVNFITAHDGFSLADLVSYNVKHNIGNGEENRDGANNNESWNCGIEGMTQNKKILEIRHRQMRNFHLALMVSRGIPMILMGDEYGHTRKGNNNTWCQDNALNWFLWEELEKKQQFYRFYRSLIHFRKENAVFSRNAFYQKSEIDFHGLEPLKPNWSPDQSFAAFTLKGIEGGSDLYVAFNASSDPVSVHFPHLKEGKHWRWVVNTASPSPYDFREESLRTPVVSEQYRMLPYSALLLEAI